MSLRSDSSYLFAELARIREREAKKYKAEFRIIYERVEVYWDEGRFDSVERELWTYQGEEADTMRQIVKDGIMVDDNTRLIPGSQIKTIYMTGTRRRCANKNLVLAD